MKKTNNHFYGHSAILTVAFFITCGMCSVALQAAPMQLNQVAQPVGFTTLEIPISTENRGAITAYAFTMEQCLAGFGGGVSYEEWVKEFVRLNHAEPNIDGFCYSIPEVVKGLKDFAFPEAAAPMINLLTKTLHCTRIKGKINCNQKKLSAFRNTFLVAWQGGDNQQKTYLHELIHAIWKWDVTFARAGTQWWDSLPEHYRKQFTAMLRKMGYADSPAVNPMGKNHPSGSGCGDPKAAQKVTKHHSATTLSPAVSQSFIEEVVCSYFSATMPEDTPAAIKSPVVDLAADGISPFEEYLFKRINQLRKNRK